MFGKIATLIKNATPEKTSSGIGVTLSDLVAMKRYVRLLSFETTGFSRSEGIGLHRSPFRGRGMEFDEVRPYHQGDDIRLIDWRVTARTGKTYTKLYREERDRPVLFLGDFRAAMRFGTRVAFKSVSEAKALAALAWASRENGDKIGALLLTEEGYYKIAPHRQMRRLMEVFNAVVAAANDTAESDEETRLSDAFAELRRVSGTGGRVFVLSDFHDFDDECKKHLAAVALHCDVICIQIYDPLEENAPPAGVYRFGDGKSVLTVDAADKVWCAAYEQSFARLRESLKTFCAGHHIIYVPLRTDDDMIKTVRAAVLGG